MKLKYMLKKTLNIKTSYVIIIVIALILVIGGCFSYAIFTATSEAKGALNIVTGNLYSLINSTDLDQNKSITIAPGEEKIVTLNLINANGRDAKVNLYYSTTSENITIGYLSSGDAAPSTSGYVLGKNGSDTDTKKIYVKIINNDTSNVTITFGSTAGLDTAELSFPNDATKKVLSAIEGNVYNNKILLAYTYNDVKSTDNYCVTGEEKTCQKTACYESDTENSCVAGTIIKYAVNDTEDKYFYVLHDDGEKMTLQQRENTTDNVAWYETADDNTKGPLTALATLEEATKEWTNVNDLTYTMGTTDFNKTNAFTGCDSYNSCTTNTYTMEEKTAKARMITIQEANALGCALDAKTCPIFMRNYLYNSIYLGGTEDNATDSTGKTRYGYWTMSAYSLISYNAWLVSYDGSLGSISSTNTDYSTRAVVEINKKI